MRRYSGLPPPDPGRRTQNNDYVFERAVGSQDDGDSNRRIDLYKRGCFVLEAKQSRLKGGKKEVVGHADLFAADDRRRDRGRRGATAPGTC